MESPARRLMARLDALAAFTDDPPRLTRLCLSPSHRRAAEQFIAWAGEAGLAARIDPVGNVRARYEGRTANAPALMIGSHIDTVRDAGRYDGALGALAALSVVEGLAAQGRRLDVAIEVVAFGDEEGVRFPRTLTGSRGAGRAQRAGGAGAEGRRRRDDARGAENVRRRPRSSRRGARRRRGGVRRIAYRAGAGAGGRGHGARRRHGDQRRDAAQRRRDRDGRPRRRVADESAARRARRRGRNDPGDRSARPRRGRTRRHRRPARRRARRGQRHSGSGAVLDRHSRAARRAAPPRRRRYRRGAAGDRRAARRRARS